MANSYLFDTTYSARQLGTDTVLEESKYRIVIGDKQGSLSSTVVTQMELLDPGINLSWQGDEMMSKTIMGGSLSFTALLDDAQLATVESLMSNTNEGDVFCLFFNGGLPSSIPYWYGHLLLESVSIRVMNDKHVVDMQFTDGLGSLRGAKWEDSPGVLYTGFKKLSFYVREIVSKLPAYAAFKDYVKNELGISSVRVAREIAWPDPLTPAGFTYDEQDHKLDKLKVRAETFNKPKKQQNRFRETEAPLTYFTAADVLDDICTNFGATACIFGGYLNLGCRLDIATLKGTYVYEAGYKYTDSGDSWTITGEYNDWDNLDADDQYSVLNGASKGYTMPIAEVYLTHEEGGSDDLYADGWFLNPEIRHVSFTNGGLYTNTGQPSEWGSNAPHPFVDLPRRDKFYDFTAPGGVDPSSTTIVGYHGYYTYPANPTGYLGFPAKTVNDLEYQSGEQIRLTFGGVAKFFARRALDLGINDVLRKVHIGSHLIVRVRIQFTTDNGVGYRLSRPVETHAISNGSPDFIRIDNVQSYYDGANAQIVNVDKFYFRKLYKEMVWLKDDASNYDDDGWFEIMVPHGDNENSGDDYGSTLYPLTQQYGGQVGYAPIGTKIKGEDNGAGVILEESGDDETLLQYFREDITFSLPYANAAQTAVLDFEDFYFEMGAQEYEPQTGPREASGASASGTWEGDFPLWKSAEAGGTGSVKYIGAGTTVAQPDYLHFTGMRVTVGDGSESSDLTTKVIGGDGYEVINLGSSRLGSRTGFVNNHVGGTVFAKEKTANSAGSFVTGSSASDFKERLQWKGHRAGEVPGIADETYDSIQRYYGEAYINLFGKAREKYSMKLVPSSTTNAYRTLKNPFEVMKMNTFQTNKAIDEYLMPLTYSWTLNDGVSGEFIKVGQVRDISTITSDEGRPIRGGGGIVGLGTGVDVIQPALESKFVTDAITVDDDTGDVTVISVKAGSTVFNADAISDGATNKVFTATEQTKLTNIEQSATANQSNDFLKNRTNHTGTQTASTISNFASAVNDVTEVAASKEVTDHFTVDGDGVIDITVKAGSTVLTSDEISEGSSNKFVTSTTFSNAAVLQDRDGSSDPVEAIIEDMDKITLLADSTIPSYGGVKKFTLANFAQAIVQSGLEDMVGEGYGSLADFSGTTGLLGDLNDDGAVGVGDLLSFLTLFGNVYESDNDLFQSSRVPLDVDSGELGVEVPTGDPSFFTLPFTSAHFDSTDNDFTAGSNGVNVLYSANQVQFVSGNGLPITAWARKKVAVKPDELQPMLFVNTTLPNQQFQFGYKVSEYDDSSNLVRETFVTLSVFFLEAPRQDGYALNRQDLDIPASGVTLDVDDNDITDIRVEMQIRGTTDAVTQYTVQLRNLRIDLRD